MPAIRDRPRVQLAHVLDEGADWQHSWLTYVPQPIPVHRPARGQVVTSLACGRCGLSVDLRIRSARATVWRRRAWLLSALLLSAPAWVLLHVSVLVRLSAGAALSVVVGSLLLFLVGFFGLVRFLGEDGVRLSEDGRRWSARRRGIHALRFAQR